MATEFVTEGGWPVLEIPAMFRGTIAKDFELHFKHKNPKTEQ